MDGTKEAAELDLRSRFPPLSDTQCGILSPKTIADRHGRILLWGLPNLFSAERQVWTIEMTYKVSY